MLTILRVDERNASAYNRLGILYAKQQQYKEAIECFEIAQSLEPSASSLHNVGLIYFETGNYDKAALAFEQALAMDSDHSARHIAYAKVQEKLGNDKRMIEALEKAIELDPIPQTLTILADAYERVGEAQLAADLRERAGKLIAERDNDLSEDELKEVAHKVGIGAVKYADLSKNRTTDYMFNWDSMLSFEGNTAPYLQYAYTRVKSLFRKAGVDMATMPVDINIAEKQEHALAVLLMQFEEVIGTVSREATPHVLCTYLYDVASAFMSFYEACPMLKDGIEPAVRDSRLALSALVAKTLEQGLTLLGIETLEKM